MNKEKYAFAQLVQFMDRNHFNYLVRKYDGDKYVKSYTRWIQLLTLMFSQLSSQRREKGGFHRMLSLTL